MFIYKSRECGRARLAMFRRARRGANGFTLLEITIVLVIIGVMLSFAMVGNDLYRNSKGLIIYSNFIEAWVSAFGSYMNNSGGILPGDNPANPVGAVVGNGGGTYLCDAANDQELSNAMLAQGVTLPGGRGNGQATVYVYQDGKGLPHQLQVCLATVSWSVPGATVGSYQVVSRNVLYIQGLTPELATQLDSMIDDQVDARFGSFREVSQAASTEGQAAQWSINATQTMDGTSGPESETAEVQAYLLLDSSN